MVWESFSNITTKLCYELSIFSLWDMSTYAVKKQTHIVLLEIWLLDQHFTMATQLSKLIRDVRRLIWQFNYSILPFYAKFFGNGYFKPKALTNTPIYVYLVLVKYVVGHQQNWSLWMMCIYVLILHIHVSVWYFLTAVLSIISTCITPSWIPPRRNTPSTFNMPSIYIL